MAERALGHDFLVGQSLCHYQIVEKIGEGGMGQVYRGRDEHLARDVAIKVFPPGVLVDEGDRKRFRKEAQTLSQLNHPNIATIYDFDTQDGKDFLAMEYISGRTLGEKLLSGPLVEKEILSLGSQLVEGLVAAHMAGVIHCDLKPANLRINDEGRLKIIDFGLAKMVRKSKLDTTTISSPDSGGVAGTLPYMAPEQVRGESLDTRTDIYAVGAVLYEMATGRQPFRQTASLQMVEAILYQSAALPSRLNSRLSPQLECLILKCLEKEPGDRYATAADLLVDLRALQRPRSEGSGTRIVPRPRRMRKAMIAVGISLILLTLSLVVFPSLRTRCTRWLGIGPPRTQRLVAVLPFTLVGGDLQATPFSDGLTETLTAKLSQLTVDPTFQVVPALDIRSNGIKALDQARDEVGVTTVVEGSLQRVGDNLRINIALVDARGRRQLGAETITVPMSDPFAVQDRIVSAAIGLLELEVAPDKLAELGKHGTQLPTAYDFYLQGRGYLQNYDKAENVENAIRVFSSALDLDPKYALAYAGRGDAYWQKYENTKEVRWIEASRQDCERALKLDSGLPAARVCLGTLYKGTGHYQQAATEFGRAIDAERTNGRAYMELAETYDLLGRPAEAEATYRRAIKLQPNYWASYNWLGVFYYRHAQFREAAEMFEQVVSLAPDNVRGAFNLATVYVGQGRYDEAIRILKHSIAIRPEAMAYTDLGNAYFYLRRFDEATAAYEEAAKLDPADVLLWWNLGDGYYWTPGKRGQATDAYRRAIFLAQSKLRVNPKDAEMLGIMAKCHAMLGEKKQALDALRAGLLLTPDDPEMRFKAALIYNHFGEIPQTLDWLEKALAAGFPRTTIEDSPDFSGLSNNPRFQELVGNK